MLGKGHSTNNSESFVSVMQMQTMQKLKYTYLYNPLNLNAASFSLGWRHDYKLRAEIKI